jgi:para-nitrobenzyl esterase
MQAYFANFIAHGDPNGEGLPKWPAVAASQGGLLRQTIDVDTHTEVDHGAARQAFLLRFLSTHANPL